MKKKKKNQKQSPENDKYQNKNQMILIRSFVSKDSTIKPVMFCSHWINNRLKSQPVFM